MAKFVLRNAAVRVASTDFSDHVSEVTVNQTAADVSTTSMGAGGQERLAGIRDDSFELTMFSDFASSSVDVVLSAQMSGSSLFLVEVWAAGTVTSATNPKFSGTAILLEYQPISGAVGDASMTKLQLPVNGTISRATA
jgi:hypothetical protein